MKKFLCIVLCVVFVFSFSACEKNSTPIDSYTEAYNEGYFEGRDWGQRQIAYYVEEEYSNAYTSELGDIISTLEIYADGIYENEFGKPLSEDELRQAIQILLEHHEDVKEIIYGIEEIEIY